MMVSELEMKDSQKRLSSNQKRFAFLNEHPLLSVQSQNPLKNLSCFDHVEFHSRLFHSRLLAPLHSDMPFFLVVMPIANVMPPPVTLGKVKGQEAVEAFLVDKDPEHCQCSDTRIPCHENNSHEWQPLDIDRSRHMEK